MNNERVSTTTVSQPSLWDEPDITVLVHFIKVIYFDGRREIHRVDSVEWDAASRDMNIWSAEFVNGEEDC